MEKHDLALANAKNRFEISRILSWSKNGKEIENENARILFSGVPFPLLNGAYFLEPDAGSDCVKSVIAEFKNSKLPGLAWLSADCVTAEKILLEHGCKLETELCDIALDITEFAIPTIEGVELKKISSPDEIKKWAELLAKAFAFPDFVTNHLEAAMLEAVPKTNGFENFLAYVNGQAVGTVTLFYAHGVVGLYNLSIDAEMRGQKLGQSLGASVLREVQSSGFRYVVGSALEQVMFFYRKAPIFEIGATNAYLI